MKKALKRIGMALALLLVLLLIGAWSLFGTFIKAASGITKLQDGLYRLEYTGDYGFDKFLEQGGADSDGAVADYIVSFLSHGFYQNTSEPTESTFGCSTVCTSDENGTVYFGRNYDWQPSRAMLVHTKPKNGYESFSTCGIDFLGFGDDYTPDGSMAERFMSLAAIYVPLDGMNEKGLIVADLMAGDKEETHQNGGKTDLTTTTAIRLLLDKAASTDEAVELLKQYDMHSSVGSAHHFAIADASGKSVVVEYVNGELSVTEADIVTNHYLTDSAKKGIGSEQSHARYEKLTELYRHADADGVRDMLAAVAQSNYPQTEGEEEITVWSVVYRPSEKTAEFYFNERYDAPYTLSLSDKTDFVKR